MQTQAMSSIRQLCYAIVQNNDCGARHSAATSKQCTLHQNLPIRLWKPLIQSHRKEFCAATVA